jgi:hypothetical protein
MTPQVFFKEVFPVYEIYPLSKERARSNDTAKARRRAASRAAG